MNFSASSETSVNTTVVLAKIRQAITISVEQSCGVVAAEAQSICPVDTGALRDSIQFGVEEEATAVVGFVEATAPYAAFVEYGTGLRGAGTYPYELPSEGVPYTGSWVYDYKRQNWQGHAAQPFMRPALDTARPEIRAIFGRNVAAASSA